MEIINHTELETERLEAMFLRAAETWSAPMLKVTIRYSRGAIYSGTFASKSPRIYVNLGQRNRYPMKIETGIAKARSFGPSWWKPSYHIKAENPYQVALFVFLHEFYHYLIHRARRNSHRKEAMCDRFAIRYLTNHCRLTVFDSNNNPVPRSAWLFQDLDEFVANRKTMTTTIRAARRPRKRV
ncbi:MAG: hypothetical protein WC975_09560 [Phycisphaerae bacterium]